MPGKIKVKVLAGRNLPVMDRASDTTDAFVEIKFGGVTHKTDVCRKSLNPHWNSTEWYRFEVDESELQDEPLQLRLMDHDTYSANDAIGKVVISLAPLLAREANNAKSTTAPHGGAVMSGWIPVFDTMHGIRGELNVIVKVELFSDFNKYKTSSCGVQFFHCPMIPPGYRATSIHGFVEELVVNDDPEYQWIDKIRTPRASNEARQVAFIKLSNQVQRLVGLKASELGANAVVGYQQDFDLEGEAGVVARATGTAVSITPLPTQNQTSNMPPCTQQQLKKYLDILATDNDNITDLNQYYQTHQEELQKLITVLNPNASSLLDEQVDEEDDKSMEMTRQSSITSYTGSVSLYQDDYVSQKSMKHITDDQSDLYKLLNRKDDDDSDSSGTLQKIKKLKTNFFTKRFARRKSDKDSDQVSLKSNSSDNSRISFVDIKNELKKFKRLKKPKFRKAATNKEDEGVGMASILARSVIHAHTSLACIAETQDSEQSPSSTLRRTSESEPTINVSDDDSTIKTTTVEAVKDIKSNEIKKVPEIHFTSLTNISTEEPEAVSHRTRTTSESCPTSPIVGRSDNSLKLPADASYYGSISSALSGESSEIYSSSDDDDESSDIRTDTEKSIETTSSVVQTVLNHEVNPSIISQMDKKLSILERMTPEPNELKHQELTEAFKSLESVPDDFETMEDEYTVEAKHGSSTLPKNLEPSASRSNTNYIKIHNPFAHKKTSKSISAPSSPTEKSGFVYRSSKRIKKSLSKISKSSMIKSLSHYSLLPKKKHETNTLSQPGSSSDVPSKAPSETVLGSAFLSYSDLLSLDKEVIDTRKVFHKSDELVRPKVSMYIGSEPVSRASLSGPSSFHHKFDHGHRYKKEKSAIKSTGIIHTAMETILIDKVQSLLIPTSPDSVSSETKQFFNDVSEKLEKVEESRNNANWTTLNTRHKAQSVPPETPKSPVLVEPFLDDFRDKTKINSDKCKAVKPTGLLHTAMETILMDKVQSLIGSPDPQPYTPKSTAYNYSHDKKEKLKKTNKAEESTGLVHTAMKTILMDKAQCMLSETPEPIRLQTEPLYDDKRNDFKDQMSCGLVNTAIETILIDKAQCLLPKGLDRVTIQTESSFENLRKTDHNDRKANDTKSADLVHTSMKTIDTDKAQNVCNMLLESMPEQEKQFVSKEIKIEQESTGLVHTAMETILLDNVQSLLCSKLLGKHETEMNKCVTADINATTLETTLSQNGQYLPASKPHEYVLNKKTCDVDSKKLEKCENRMKDNISKDLIHSVYLTSQTNNVTVNTKSENFINPPVKYDSNELIQTADVDNPQYLINTGVVSDTVTETKDTKNKMENIKLDNQEHKSTRIVGVIMKTVPTDAEKTTATSKESKSKNKKLIRQDSVHSVTDNESQKMSEAAVNVPCKVTKPMLQHFHPILSGVLETIPSLPESSLDQSDSLDLVDTNSGTNDVSVCDNSHAVCDVGRSERDRDKCDKDKGSPRHARHESYGGREPNVTSHAPNASLNAASTPMGIHRRSSDSDLSVTPKGGSLNTSAGNVGSGGGAILRPSMNSNNLDLLEYPFLTMTEYPPGFIVHIGGTVCARSVKLVDAGGESAARAAWWAELRTELRAHARALRCNAVIAYKENTAICEDVCVLSVSGTAVVINLDCGFNAEEEAPTVVNGSKGTIEEVEAEACSVAHVPYSAGAGPYRAELSTCGGCRRARVPAVLLATCAKPNRLTSYAKAITLTAVAARVRRAPPAAEPGARDISDQLPFLEYELHKLLLAKLRMQGANALFSLQTQIAIGERCVMALASGTAVRLAALPPPTPPRIKASEHDKDALDIQRALWDSFNANKAANGYDIVGASDHNTNGILPEIEGEDAPVLDLCADKDACVLELDEAEDVETARALATRRMHMQVLTNGQKAAVGAPPHAFAQVWRARLGAGGGGGGGCSGAAERHVARALAGVAYKLRRLQPAALVTLRFHLELPEDEIQLLVSGAAIPLQDPTKSEHAVENGDNAGNHGNGCGDADDDIFTLDEEQLVKSSQHSEVVEEKTFPSSGQVGAGAAVALSPLGRALGGRAARRLCALRLLFVRETTSVRELGGLSGFLHTFTCEVLAIVRAYTAALGGNALTSFYLTQLMLQDNAHKNQGQCLLSVGGDVVHITY